MNSGARRTVQSCSFLAFALLLFAAGSARAAGTVISGTPTTVLQTLMLTSIGTEKAAPMSPITIRCSPLDPSALTIVRFYTKYPKNVAKSQWVDVPVTQQEDVSTAAVRVTVPPLPSGKTFKAGKVFVQVLQQTATPGIYSVSNVFASNRKIGLKVLDMPKLKSAPGTATLSFLTVQMDIARQMETSIMGTSLDTQTFQSDLAAQVTALQQLISQVQSAMDNKQSSFTLANDEAGNPIVCNSKTLVDADRIITASLAAAGNCGSGPVAVACKAWAAALLSGDPSALSSAETAFEKAFFGNGTSSATDGARGIDAVGMRDDDGDMEFVKAIKSLTTATAVLTGVLRVAAIFCPPLVPVALTVGFVSAGFALYAAVTFNDLADEASLNDNTAQEVLFNKASNELALSGSLSVITMGATSGAVKLSGPVVEAVAKNAGSFNLVIGLILSEDDGDVMPNPGLINFPSDAFIPTLPTIGQDQTTTFSLAITIIPAGAGTVITVPAGLTYAAGALVTLRAKATPGTDSKFVGWSGGVTGADMTLLLVMYENMSVTATFTSAFDGVYLGTQVGTLQFGDTDPYFMDVNLNLVLIVQNGNIDMGLGFAGTVDINGQATFEMSGLFKYEGTFTSTGASGTWTNIVEGGGTGGGTWQCSWAYPVPAGWPLEANNP